MIGTEKQVFSRFYIVADDYNKLKNVVKEVQNNVKFMMKIIFKWF